MSTEAPKEQQKGIPIDKLQPKQLVEIKKSLEEVIHCFWKNYLFLD